MSYALRTLGSAALGMVLGCAPEPHFTAQVSQNYGHGMAVPLTTLNLEVDISNIRTLSDCSESSIAALTANDFNEVSRGHNLLLTTSPGTTLQEGDQISFYLTSGFSDYTKINEIECMRVHRNITGTLQAIGRRPDGWYASSLLRR